MNLERKWLGWRWGCLGWLMAAWLFWEPGAARAWSQKNISSSVPDRNLSPHGSFQTVDLSHFYRTRFDALPANHPWHVLPLGRQTFHGIPFQIEGCMEVTGMAEATEGNMAPSRVEGIPVGRTARRLYLLHGATGIEKDAVPIATLVLHYAGGEIRDWRIAYGLHVRNCFKLRGERSDGLADPDSFLAWTSAAAQNDRFNPRLRLFLTAFDNPLPDREIVSLDLVSLFSQATPFVIAITLDNGELVLNRNEVSKRLFKKASEWKDSVYRRQFQIQAIDASDGHPLTNAAAYLTLNDGKVSFPFGAALSGAGSKMALDYPPQQTVAFNLVVKAPGYAPGLHSQSRTNPPGDFTETVSVKLERGTPVGGLVTTPAGEPISGVEVLLSKSTTEGPKRFFEIVHDVAVTDARGRWSSTALPFDFAGFRFELSHPQYKPAVFWQANRSNAAPALRTPPTVSAADLLAGKAVMFLEPTIIVTGQIKDGNGLPVSRAEVYYLDDRGRSEARLVCASDAQGGFSFRVQEPGEGGLAILAKDAAPKFQPVVFAPRMPPVRVVLSKGRRLTGRVRDTEQRPVPGATVRAELWHNTSLLRWQTQTDAGGRFTWDNGPEDEVQYSVSASNYYTMRMQASGMQSEVNLLLQKTFMVFGKVVDAETKKPLDQFTVMQGYRYNYSALEPIRWQRYNVFRGRNGTYAMRINNYGNATNWVVVEATGYLPALSAPFSKAGWFTNDFELRRGKGIRGMVTLPSGEPAPNCVVVVAEPGESPSMDREGQLRYGNSHGSYARTDRQGHFELPAKLDPRMVFAVHDSGYAESKPEDITRNGTLRLQPWGRIKGLLRVGPTNWAGQTVILQNEEDFYGGEEGPSARLYLWLRAETDAKGEFAFDRVPAGWRKVSLQYAHRRESGSSSLLTHGVNLEVKPGEISEVTLGGTGRPVRGRIALTGGSASDVDWMLEEHRLTSRMPPVPGLPSPTISANTTAEEQQRIWAEQRQRQREFWQSPEGRALVRQRRSYALLFETNGTFRIENVPPGTYDLSINLNEREEYPGGGYSYRQIGSLNQEIVVPPPTAERPNEPFDVGALAMVIRRPLRIGQMAPPFETKTLNGGTFRLEDCRGTNVLLHFGVAQAGLNSYEMESLKSLHQTYGANGLLLVVGLSLDGTAKQAQDYADANGVKWLVCHLGQWSETQIPALFGVEGVPAAILVGPDGRVLAKDLRGSMLRTNVRRLLTAAPKPTTVPE